MYKKQCRDRVDRLAIEQTQIRYTRERVDQRQTRDRVDRQRGHTLEIEWTRDRLEIEQIDQRQIDQRQSRWTRDRLDQRKSRDRVDRQRGGKLEIEQIDKRQTIDQRQSRDRVDGQSREWNPEMLMGGFSRFVHINVFILLIIIDWIYKVLHVIYNSSACEWCLSTTPSVQSTHPRDAGPPAGT